uniref:Uncharacterized protein n=1 Tax=Salix viminalis TaxID=40686 RepID=A0A6N2MNY8_SALVM
MEIETVVFPPLFISCYFPAMVDLLHWANLDDPYDAWHSQPERIKTKLVLFFIHGMEGGRDRKCGEKDAGKKLTRMSTPFLECDTEAKGENSRGRSKF